MMADVAPCLGPHVLQDSVSDLTQVVTTYLVIDVFQRLRYGQAPPDALSAEYE